MVLSRADDIPNFKMAAKTPPSISRQLALGMRGLPISLCQYYYEVSGCKGGRITNAVNTGLNGFRRSSAKYHMDLQRCNRRYAKSFYYQKSFQESFPSRFLVTLCMNTLHPKRPLWIVTPRMR